MDDGPMTDSVRRALEDIQAKDGILEALKVDINNFLWPRLPHDVTLGEADELAAEIHDLIADRWADPEPAPKGTTK